MKRLLHIIDLTSEWSGKVISWLILVTMLIISFEIIMRMFGRAQTWAFDVTLFTAGTVYVIGGAYTLLRNRHVKIDILHARISPRMQSLLDLITFPGFLVFVGVLLWVGGIRAWDSFQIKETLDSALQPPIWPVRWTIPLGGFLILMQGLAKAVRDFYMVVVGERLD